MDGWYRSSAGSNPTFPISDASFPLPSAATCHPAANIAVVEGVPVYELNGVVALLFHRRHRDDVRLGPQTQAHERIRRIAIRHDDSSVFVGEDAPTMHQLADGAFVLRGRLVHPELVAGCVGHDERESVSIGFFSDRFHFIDSRQFGLCGLGSAG